jgi:hypothetical protein
VTGAGIIGRRRLERPRRRRRIPRTADTGSQVSDIHPARIAADTLADLVPPRSAAEARRKVLPPSTPRRRD